MKRLFTVIVALCFFGTVSVAFAGKLMVTITPSHDNPFFKSEAVGAEAKAKDPPRR